MSLKYVQIETTSTCNQRCFFCPVSIEKKAKVQLSTERLDQIIDGLKQYPIENIAISGFTEPTHDKDLVGKVAALRAAGFKVSIFTNGSGLKPELTDQLLMLGVSGFTLNLSTLNEDEYRETRGTQDLRRVIPNIDYLIAQTPVQDKSVEITIAVIGRLDGQHAKNLREIDSKYADAGVVNILIIPMVEFAGKSPTVLREKPYQQNLQGCMWERHTEWMHFNADGDAILCCHDYSSKYNSGSIDKADVTELYQGEQMAQWRRWLEGEEEAPKDFICRGCLYAKRENHAAFLRAYFCETCVLPQEFGIKNACKRCGDVGMVIDYFERQEVSKA